MRATVRRNCSWIAVSGSFFAVALATFAQQPPQPAPQEKVAAIRDAFQASQAALRSYEWIETTAVALRGEEKSRQQKRCYYGAEGALQKVAVGAAPEPGKTPRGVRGRIVENKKEELTGYLKAAVDLVHAYLPPDPARIQAAKDAGKAWINPAGPPGRLHVELRDYLKPGDVLAVDLDLANSRPLGLRISTYLDAPSEPVSLDVQMASFPDGTIYTAISTLEAPAKAIRVSVESSGYRKAGS